MSSQKPFTASNLEKYDKNAKRNKGIFLNFKIQNNEKMTS